MKVAAVIDRGRGAPIVLIPGIQGRWEWMLPAVEALSASHRVLSFSLHEADTEDLFQGFLNRMLDRAGLSAATLVGVSLGGVIAARYAARQPARVTSLVLASAPSPRWEPDRRQTGYLRRPLLSAPSFALDAVSRLMPEVIASHDTWPGRLEFLVRHLGHAVRFPASPSRMAAWVRAWKAEDLAADFARITAPTLVITGEAHLDRVVAQASTLEYLTLISGARHVILPHTGHIGLVSTPDAFAKLVGTFIDEISRQQA